MALPLRSEIDAKDKWRIEDLFATDEAWEAEVNRLSELVSKEPEFKGRLCESDDVLCKAIKACDELECALERVYVYANQKYYEDTTNSKYQNYAGMSQNLLTKYSEKYSYQEPEILAMPEDKLKELVNTPGELGAFSQYFKNLLRQKEHILSEEMESVMANVGDVAQAAKDIFSSFNNADIKFKQAVDSEGLLHDVSHGKYGMLMESGDRVLRENAFKSIYNEYSAHKNTLASMYNANVKQKLFFARMRHFNSSLEGALHGSAIPVAVYDNLISAVNDNMGLMHRYVKLRKQVLGVDELHMYDVYAPLVDNYEYKVTFEEAKERVCEGLKPLGDFYGLILKKGYENGWIDVRENQGKRSGAFSWGAYGTHPYVFLNYQDNLNNMFTLAHEMGHAIHTYLSNENQPHIYAGYRIFVAEVASTCNEALLIRDMIAKSTDRREKLYLLNHFMEQFKGTMFRQTMFAEFEKVTHEMVQNGVTLTADELCRVYKELNEKYFGPEMVVDEEIAMEWARIPHFYTPFYVYQYATGFAAAVAISEKILSEGDSAVAGYLEFLKSGSSDYPIEVLKKAGVDMAKPEVVDRALKVFESLLDEFERLAAE